jgi:hypothetical protein
MVGSRCSPSVGALVTCALLSAASLRAEPRPRVELSGLFVSDNWLRGAAPEPPFWDALGSLGSGRSSRVRLLALADEPAILPNVSTRARLGLELELDGLGEGTAVGVHDASSSLGLMWRAAPRTLLTLEAYPFDTDYRRVGYLHALDWGGTAASRRESIFLARKGGAPGCFLQLAHAGLTLFVGAKWARVGEGVAAARRLWGGLGGGSLELGPSLRVDSGFGLFQRERGFVEGASLRWVWHDRVGEPEVASEPFRPPTLRETPDHLVASSPQGAALALEGVMLALRVPGQRTLLGAPAAALYGSLRGARGALHAALVWRSLPFVLRSDPGSSGEEQAIAESPEQAELTAWLGGSLTLEPSALVPSFELGVRLPSSLYTPSSWPGVMQTWVAGSSPGLEPLPLGSQRLPLLAARLGLRWQASQSLSLAFACDYQRDANRVRLKSVGSTLERVFDQPDSLRLSVGVQARF